MKELYIFDFDGVLVDTILDSIKAFNQVLSEFDKETYSEDITNFRHEDFWQFLASNTIGIEAEFQKRFYEVYENSQMENTHAYNGMIEVLTELQENKILAICSNRNERHLNMLCDKYLKDINFKYISGYKEAVPNKPDPFRLNEIIEKANISKEDVIYFGDRIVDVETAKNAGIDMILVRYGQGNEEDFSNPYPLAVIDSPTEIKELIKKGLI